MTRWVAGIATCVLVACVTPPPATVNSSNVEVSSADMRGSIRALTEDGRYLIESPPGSSGVGKCVVRVTPSSELISVDGTAVELLSVGAEVSVWFTGPVMKSYPAQATASRLVVHRGAQTPR